MVTKRLSLGDTEETLLLCGEQDANLRMLEKRLGVQIFARSSTLAIRGNPRKVDQAIASLEELRDKIRNGGLETVQRSGKAQALKPFKAGAEPAAPAGEDPILIGATGKPVYAQTPQQKAYVDAISARDMVLGVGPAGTGKTFLAVVCALRELHGGRVGRIVLTRPVVEAGEKLGFLPGDFYDKVNPYLRPLYDAFYTLLGPERFRIYREDETVEIVPLAYMRGRTLENAFVILDEAQNTTPEQMKMFLTRMGGRSKVVVTGDITQVDLGFKQQSGFVHALRVLDNVEEVSIVRFGESDIVRHPLVRRILRAYEDFEKQGPSSGA